MTLPDFVGIGAPRSGTSWLNTLLASHLDVYTPTLRDEINFFDDYYERGLDWYEGLFPDPEAAAGYRAIGEVTPQYLECPECPERIFTTLPDSKLLVMLRHPVDRAYSQYGFYVQRRNYRDSFEEFVTEMPRSLERGFYSRYLRRYLRYFDRSRMLVLVFEEAVADVARTKQVLAEFLDLDPARFPEATGKRKVNPSTVPKFQFLYGFVAKTGRLFRKLNLEPIVDFVMRSRIPRMLAKGRSLPPLDDGVRRRLSELYVEEFRELEECMQVDLAPWRA